ncbi:MAG: hypothetical protein Q4G13_05335 [Moraxella sp.]|nr:hypothetical protein [Moraxella sp.]
MNIFCAKYLPRIIACMGLIAINTAYAKPMGIKSDNTQKQYHSSAQVLPSALLDGYWLLPLDIDGEYAVVDFRQEADGNYSTTNYRFECQDNRRFRLVYREKSLIRPTSKGMELVFEGQEPVFGLAVRTLEPKKWLVLNQYFKHEPMKSELPDGINFAYLYEPKLVPYCAIYGK